MPFIVKLLITEAVSAVIGFAFAATDDEKLSTFGAWLCLLSVIALIVTGLLFVWSL